MALLGGGKYSRDLAAARRTFTEWVNYYASLILPGLKVRVIYENLHPSSEAWATLYDDKTIEVTVNAIFLEANMYNLQSEDMRGLPVHELCHLKIFLDEFEQWAGKDYGSMGARTHRDPKYLACVKKFCHERHARACAHPGRTSFKNYFGGESGMVPVDIFYIFSYFCPRCNTTWDENVLMNYGKMHIPDKCIECGGPIENVQHLTPREVLLIDLPDDFISYR